MKRKTALLLCVVALALWGCGDDSGSNNGSNNGGSNNGGSNNGGSNNGGSNNGGSNNGGSNNGASNNGASNNGMANNGITNNNGAGTNNGMANNGIGTNNGTNNGTNGGTINVQASMTPTAGPAGTEVTATFTLTNFEFDGAAIGMANEPGKGHYHIYLGTVEPANQLIESGDNPGTFVVNNETMDLAAGMYDLVFSVHKNDHTEYQNPIQFSIPFEVTAP